jgi:hypothetical protein
MKRLLLRGLLLALPFVVVGALIVAVDPFDYFGVSHLVSDSVKEETSGKLHYTLWKLGKFKRNPGSRLILGDSRMAGLRTSDVDRVAGEPYANVAYGGGTIAEAVDTYWFAAERAHLEAVYLGIGFINFNAFQAVNRVPEAEAMLANPALYLSNRLVLRAALLAGFVQASGRQVNVEAPGMTREAFWRFQLEESAPQLLRSYSYPVAYEQALTRVAADCRKRGTRLVIVIPPTHVELQRKVREFGLEAEEARFKAFVATLGPVYDFDYPNAYTEDRANFSDPFHFTNDDQIVREIWGHERRYAQYTP